MKNISFIHCADIHLGHMQYNEPQRLQDFAEAFRQVVNYAIAEQVDFVLISGDFFHKRAISAETLGQAVELLIPLKERGIPVVAIEGNHDKAFYQDRNSWLGFLNNQEYLYLLSPQFSEGSLELECWDYERKGGAWIELAGVRIYGLGYLGITTGNRLAEAVNLLQDKEETPVILMLHAAINRLLGNDLGGIRKEVLEPFKQKADYIALGHIHSRYQIDDWIYNPGSLECVHLDEHASDLGKGFYHVTVRDNSWSSQHIPSICRSVARYSVSLTDTKGADEAFEKVFSEIENNKPPVQAQIQVILQGSIPYSPLTIDEGEIIEGIKKKFDCLYVEILNHTNLPQENEVESTLIVDREGIERWVLGQLLSQEKCWQPGELEQAVDVVKRLKDLVLSGEKGSEIIEYLKDRGEELLAEELPEGSTPNAIQDVPSQDEEVGA